MMPLRRDRIKRGHHLASTGAPADASTTAWEVGAFHAQTRSQHPSSFWGALDSPAQRAFRSLAYERTFAAGAEIMNEGGPATHVLVILRGRVQLSARYGDNERVLAERGVGQLIGERGMLQISTRSATVKALEAVRALVMKTDDFAVFLEAHPRVLGIVEHQVYERLTEDPAQRPADRRQDDRQAARRRHRVAPSAGRVLAMAARLLPAADRARYAAEFRSELWELVQAGDGRWGQLGYAGRQLVAACQLRAALQAPRRRRVMP